MSTRDYPQTRVCGACGFSDQRTLDEMQAAFEETRAWTEPCVRCGSSKFRSESCAMPDLSERQLEYWAERESVCFLSEDEDIILAQADKLELLLACFDSGRTLMARKRVLLAALFCIVYDELRVPTRRRQAIIDRIVHALRARRVALEEVGVRHIARYIYRPVAPLLADVLPSEE